MMSTQRKDGVRAVRRPPEERPQGLLPAPLSGLAVSGTVSKYAAVVQTPPLWYLVMAALADYHPWSSEQFYLEQLQLCRAVYRPSLIRCSDFLIAVSETIVAVL